MNWYKTATITDYDRERLEGTGHQILDTEKFGDYNLTLINLPMGDIELKQLGLAYSGMSFTDIEQQSRKRQMRGFPDLDLEGMKNKIQSWINQYGPLYMGVNNFSRFDKYVNILQYLGFATNTQEILGVPFLEIK